MTIYEIAYRYFPRLWNADRIRALQEAGKLTKKEMEKILSKDTKNT